MFCSIQEQMIVYNILNEVYNLDVGAAGGLSCWYTYKLSYYLGVCSLDIM